MVGLPVAFSGGQLTAQAPVHSLIVPESRVNRYRVRPCESTRIFPRLWLDPPPVAAAPPAFFGGRDGAFELPPPPQPATASAARTSNAAPAGKAINLLYLM